MDRTEYERLLEAIEQDYRRNLEALETVWVLSERYPAEEPRREASYIAESAVGGVAAEESAVEEATEEERPPVVDSSADKEMPEETEEAPETKDCRGCGEPKPLASFNKDIRTADGLGHKCQDCRKAAAGVATAKRRAKKSGGGKKKAKKAEDTSTTPGEVAQPDHPTRDPTRTCASGEKCLLVPELGEPAKLAKSNPGPLCHRCKEAEEKPLVATVPGESMRSEADSQEIPPPVDPASLARVCANGPRCVKADPDDLYPQPAILDDANPGPLCRGCQKRAGVAA